MQSDVSDQDSSRLEFAIFGIENVAEALGIPGNIAYRKLTIESNILSDSLVERTV